MSKSNGAIKAVTEDSFSDVSEHSLLFKKLQSSIDDVLITNVRKYGAIFKIPRNPRPRFFMGQTIIEEEGKIKTILNMES